MKKRKRVNTSSIFLFLLLSVYTLVLFCWGFFNFFKFHVLYILLSVFVLVHSLSRKKEDCQRIWTIAIQPTLLHRLGLHFCISACKYFWLKFYCNFKNFPLVYILFIFKYKYIYKLHTHTPAHIRTHTSNLLYFTTN